MLEGSDFLLTNGKFTIIDVAFYNEITPVFLLSKHDLPEMNFSNLSQWILKMSEVPEVSENDERFLTVLIENGFVRTTPFWSLEDHEEENYLDENTPEVVYREHCQDFDYTEEIIPFNRTNTERKRNLSIINERNDENMPLEETDEISRES